MRLVLVGGAPRSGTTLVQNMLDCHPDVAAGPEFDHLPAIASLWEQVRRGSMGRQAVLVQPATVDRAFAGLVHALLEPFARERGVSVVAEKTPWNVLRARDLLDFLPGARFVLVVRDPRAVIASMLEVGRRASMLGARAPYFTKSLRSAIFAVRTCARAAADVLRAHPDRVHLVRYEFLVRDPRRVVERLVAALDLAFHEQMLRPDQQRHAHEATIGGPWYDMSSFYRPIEPSRLETWRHTLTRWEVAQIEEAFRFDPNLREIGVDVEPSTPRALRLSARGVDVAERALEDFTGGLIALGRRQNILRELVRRQPFGRA